MGQFDLLLEDGLGKVEVECKTVTEDTGAQIKAELNVQLAETFSRAVSKGPPASGPGLFVMRLKRPAAECKQLARQLQTALQSDNALAFENDDFSLAFLVKPEWQKLADQGEIVDFNHLATPDADIGFDAWCVKRVRNQLFCLVVRPHKPTAFKDRIIEVIKSAADQCSGQNPSVIWMHFVGVPEHLFLPLAQFSLENPGGGLSAIVAYALHPDVSSTDRAHVRNVRFSADPIALTNRPAIRPDLLIAQGVYAGGLLFDVTNPHSRFVTALDL